MIKVRSSFKKMFLLGLGIVLSFSVFAAGNQEGSIEPQEFSSENKVNVFVAVQPQQYFVRRIGGDRVDVSVIVEAGRDPHLYDPTPRQVTALSQAHIFFGIGMPFEEIVLPKIQSINKKITMINTIEGLDLIEGVPHYHYDDDGNPYLHGDDDPDMHVWLGPFEVLEQARSIAEALSAIDPSGTGYYEKAFEEFSQEIEAMHEHFTQMLAPYKGKSILVFHPAFAYFVRTYGITQRAIELDGKEPSPRHLERLIDVALSEGAKVVITQPEFPKRSAELIARAIGGTVLSINPLGADWPALMEDLAQGIAKGVF